ncbi:hypothetical protein VW07_21885 [Salmonella enterica subsp. enterica serovar Enteritidis]|nr:hypothetical protein [Salmonella enterica subsp. enterica serovar Enteritidis]
MMSLWDALRMNMMISYQELVRTFLRCRVTSSCQSTEYSTTCLSSQDFKIVHTRRYGKSRIASQLHD